MKKSTTTVKLSSEKPKIASHKSRHAHESEIKSSHFEGNEKIKFKGTNGHKMSYSTYQDPEKGSYVRIKDHKNGNVTIARDDEVKFKKNKPKIKPDVELNTTKKWGKRKRVTFNEAENTVQTIVPNIIPRDVYAAGRDLIKQVASGNKVFNQLTEKEAELFFDVAKNDISPLTYNDDEKEARSGGLHHSRSSRRKNREQLDEEEKQDTKSEIRESSDPKKTRKELKALDRRLDKAVKNALKAEDKSGKNLAKILTKKWPDLEDALSIPAEDAVIRNYQKRSSMTMKPSQSHSQNNQGHSR